MYTLEGVSSVAYFITAYIESQYIMKTRLFKHIEYFTPKN